jgi:hypothetical protein
MDKGASLFQKHFRNTGQKEDAAGGPGWLDALASEFNKDLEQKFSSDLTTAPELLEESNSS